MLEEVHVQDLALIDEAWLEFGPGLSVLTGETGAGKTALVGAIKLLIGERADSSLVRSGSDAAVVEGRITGDGGEWVVRRRVTADGRSRCTLDGEMASVGELSQRVGPLFDLHGQHEHQALLSPSNHVSYLDRYVGQAAIDALGEYRTSLALHADALDALTEVERRLSESQEREGYLRFVAEEIGEAGLAEGEDDELESRLPALRHGEKLAEAASEAYVRLRSDGGATDALAEATSLLARVSGLDPAADALHERLLSALGALEDVALEIREYGERIDHDPSSLNEVEARLSAISALKKKYGPTLDEVLLTLENTQALITSIESSDAEILGARRRVEETRVRAAHAGARLSELRAAAIPGFVSGLESQVEALAMQGARFDIALTDLPFEEWTSEGPQRVEFLYAASPEQAAKPLAKIASGGEISRVMLALKDVLGSADNVPVLVFDEVDAGIGGSAARAVGARLKGISRTHQVLVVTHLAQVAAYADAHMVVEKIDDGQGTRTRVRRITGDERVGEIARMLSGGDTATGRAHAQELLATVGG